MKGFVGTRVGRRGTGTKIRGAAVDAKERERKRKYDRKEEEEYREKERRGERWKISLWPRSRRT